ncbi:MAG TPA: hypothetical protein VHU44_05810 [Acidobacteriaceae bacterium]|jgi:hypothetical protein|nr:hypothetical protein [Acidobacteriaceae bacterium]
MKRILKLLVRLYPSAWRRRYCAEYEALLEDGTPRVTDIFDVLWEAGKMQIAGWSSLRIIVAAAVVGTCAAVAISFAVRPRYVAQTVISVTAQRPLDDSMNSSLPQIIDAALTDEFLGLIIQQEHLYPRERAHMPIHDVMKQMRRDISIRPLQRGRHGRPSTWSPGQGAFAIYFSYPNARIAQVVDKQLASRFAEFNIVTNGTQTSNPHLTFSVADPASLPMTPTFPKRGVFGAGGLFMGFSCGLIAAMTLRSRRDSAVTTY